MLLLVTVFAFSACSSDDEEDFSYDSEQQKNALSALHGTFSYTLEITNWTTTIDFLEQYHPAKDAFDPSTNSTIPKYIQGKLRITYYEGSSYEYYYRLNKDATRIYMGFDINNWEYVDAKDFRFVDNDQFKMKETKDFLWETYNRK